MACCVSPYDDYQCVGLLLDDLVSISMHLHSIPTQQPSLPLIVSCLRRVYISYCRCYLSASRFHMVHDAVSSLSGSYHSTLYDRGDYKKMKLDDI